jgi:hypothetical protein
MGPKGFPDVRFNSGWSRETTVSSIERPPSMMTERAGRYIEIGGRNMLETIAVVLLVLWILGLVSSYTMGGFIHLLLVMAIVVFLIRFISGRRPVV